MYQPAPITQPSGGSWSDHPLTRATTSFIAATLVITAGVLLAGAPARAAGASAPSAKSAVAATPAPFAKVYLALRGCTSCAHCRTTIRQMAKGSAKGGEARLNGDQVEVSYAKPRVLPLREVIKTLAEKNKSLGARAVKPAKS